MNQNFVKSMALLTAGLGLFSCKSQQKEEVEKPNIMFIVVDDLGWADLACYGADLHETPNIDRLASKSTIFTNSYSAGPVSSPTRASLMTGKYPARLHFTIWSEAASVAERKNQERFKYLPPQTIETLPLEEITIAEKLKENGYLTAHVGKWHIGDFMHFPETQGFDVSVAASQRGATSTFFYPYRAFGFGEFRYIGDLDTDPEGKYFTDREDEYLTDRLTDEALKIIEDAGTRPFYLNLCYFSVHTPIEAKPNDIEFFKTKISPEFHHQNETYAAMVKAVDDNVGRLLKKLDDQGIAENTIVILISDNGGFIGKNNNKVVTNNFPLRSGKGSLYEGGIRIPTIIFYPQNPGKGQKIETPISTIDFFPTVLEIIGTKNDIPIDGKSFFPLIKGESDISLQNRTLFWHYPHYYATTTPVSAIRDGNWKLLEYLGDEQIELYNLENDLGESQNLVNEEPQKAKELLEKLHNWMHDVDAQGVTLNPNFRSN